jgi:hypothetical protein
MVLDLAGIGLFSGFFVVPLFALIQSRTPRGRTVARDRRHEHPERVFIVAGGIGHWRGPAAAAGLEHPAGVPGAGIANIVVAAGSSASCPNS